MTFFGLDHTPLTYDEAQCYQLILRKPRSLLHLPPRFHDVARWLEYKEYELDNEARGFILKNEMYQQYWDDIWEDLECLDHTGINALPTHAFHLMVRVHFGPDLVKSRRRYKGQRRYVYEGLTGPNLIPFADWGRPPKHKDPDE
jgi:hypothetical protein